MQHQVLVDTIKYYLAVIEFIDFTVSSSTFSAKLSPVSVCLIFFFLPKGASERPTGSREGNRQQVKRNVARSELATLRERDRERRGREREHDLRRCRRRRQMAGVWDRRPSTERLLHASRPGNSFLSLSHPIPINSLLLSLYTYTYRCIYIVLREVNPNSDRFTSGLEQSEGRPQVLRPDALRASYFTPFPSQILRAL